MENAYDKVEWNLLELVMKRIGFSNIWINRVMSCVNSVSYSLLLSRKRVGGFKPSRGIKQEGPLSPQLFLIIADTLPKMISKVAHVGQIEGNRVKTLSPLITHLFFTDDVLFFLKASQPNLVRLKQILNIYYSAR